MKDYEKYILIGAGVLLLLLIPGVAMSAGYVSITDWLIPEFEGFIPVSEWDYKQYTWGYGTRAPGPGLSITRDAALKAMRLEVNRLYNVLSPAITRALSPQQWAAYLSFAFNEGEGAAGKLVDDINSGDDSALESHWKLYIYAGGVVLQDLVDRRNKEWEVWTGAAFN